MLDHKTATHLVPMSREELKLRGRKNTRRRDSGLRQLWWLDGLGNAYMLLGSEMARFGLTEKWPRCLNANYGIKAINAMRCGDAGAMTSPGQDWRRRETRART